MKKFPELRDDDGGGAWTHPGAAIDGRPPGPAVPAELLAAKHSAVDMFMQLFTSCLPCNSAYRGGRRWKAGYRRMVAIAYEVTPEIFVGMTQAEVAAELGIHSRVFERLLREVRAMLASRARPIASERRAHDQL